MIIKPSTALRNDYTAISELAHKEAQPIYITKNGEGDLVVMSIEAYEEKEALAQLKTELFAIERERLLGGKTYTMEEVKQGLEEIYRRG